MSFGAVRYGGAPFGSTAATAGTPGFSSTTFGIPGVALIAVGFVSGGFGTANTKPIAVGFSGTTFGAPRWGTFHIATTLSPTAQLGVAAIEPHVMPIYGTGFGLPNSPYLQTGDAAGLFGTAFGVDARLTAVCQAAAAFPSTVVSPAYTPVSQGASALGVSTTQLGTPMASRRNPGLLGKLTAAFGFTGTATGVPTAITLQGATANAFSSTSFGAPRAVGMRMASGFCRTRTGARHKAASRTNVRYVDGFIVGGAGTPNAAIRNRAVATAPTSGFGTPLLTRSTPC